MDCLKHCLHLDLEASLEVTHVDTHKVSACLHDCLINSLFAETFSLLNGSNHVNRKVNERLSAQFFKTICMKVE